jgi:formylglycine-generating enzyme required for sulfatase activity
MNKIRVGLILVLIFISALPIAAALAQTSLPPTETPAPTPAPLCPPDLQKTCDWAGGLIATYGPWAAVFIVLALVTLWYFQRANKVAEARVEKVFEKAADEIEAVNELSQATTRYLNSVLDDYRFVKFRGQGARGKGIEPPELDQVYVSLRMRPEADEERVKHMGKSVAKTDSGSEMLGGLREAKAEPIDLLQALRLSPKVAVVGVAGSGKSTLLQWAGLAVTRHCLRDPKLTVDQKAFVESLSQAQPPLPVLLPLRDYNRHCKDQNLDRTATSLLDFLSVYFAKQYPTLKLPIDFFANHLSVTGRGCLLMFDGVDEVASDDRQFVREAIEDLLTHVCAANPRNRYLVTSRIYAYFGAAEVSGFRECLVQNLEPAERDRLIHGWYASVYSGDKARLSAMALCDSIASSDSRVQQLAVTPLMITIFALVHYDGGELPRQRAALYERAVYTLLTESEFKEGEAVKELQKWGGQDPGLRRNRLAQIAYAMHAQGQAGDEMAEDDLVELIWKAFGNDKTTARLLAREFIQLVSDRGGLLEFQNNRYGFFTHRTFREFLAGRYLAEELSDEWETVLPERFADDGWREPILLAVGYLAIGGETRANKLIRLLADFGLTDEDKAKALTLAGLAYADLPVPADSPLDPKRLETRDRLAPTMLAALTIDPPVVSADLRRPLGMALAAVEDPRFATPLWQLPAEKVLGAEGYLVPIPAGVFKMGTSDDEAQRLAEQESTPYDDEKPQHPVDLPAYALARYPVTNADYKRFKESADYANPLYWPGEAGLWLKGELDTEPYVLMWPKDNQDDLRNWLKNRPVEKRRQPYYWDDPQWNAANLPVVGVTWYEAQAYCLWLTAKLQHAKLIDSTQSVTLPTEAQWEKAARIPQTSEVAHTAKTSEVLSAGLWPWGDVWDKEKCNSDESKFSATTPVGMYPNGVNALGIHDLIGNVWEWTTTVWGTNLNEPEFKYPYLADDGREDPNAHALRVLRGGSWFSNRRLCRAAYRDWYVPVGFDGNVGFRVALSPVRV